MKLGSTTLLDKCAAGGKLPKTGPCPECGARSNEPCPKRAAQDAERLAALEAEIERLRGEIDELKIEQRLFDEDAGERQRLVDRIAELIGVPKNDELDQVTFELWFTKNAALSAGHEQPPLHSPDRESQS